jgi:hypothetical protein
LTNATRCVAAQGAHDQAFGKVVEYVCPGTPTVLLGTMTLNGKVGSFQSASYSQAASAYQHGPNEAVKTAWYAIGDDGDQLAAEHNVCSASALAYVAQAAEPKKDRLTNGARITGTGCADGYAIAGDAGNDFEGEIIFRATDSGWKQLAAADIFEPSPGESPVSAPILRDLQSRLKADHAPDHVDY